MVSSTKSDDVRPGRVVGVLALAGIVAAIMQTLVVPLIGDLPSILDTSPSNASWVVTATLLSAAVATPVAGRLGDMYGKRRMLLVSVIPLVVGSVVCALSSAVVPMIVGRGLQGLGMGVVPLGISLLRDLLPPEKLGSSIALMSASMGVGGALGLPFAAAVAENSSWRVLFWVAAALSLLVAVLAWLFVPAGRGGRGLGALRPAGRGRPGDRPRLPAAGRVQGLRLGLDERHHARPVRRRGRRAAGLGPVGAAHR